MLMHGLRQDGRLRGKLVESISSALERGGHESLKKMVVRAVRYEPVSGWQFPANREFAGNF
jgi:hypothetical protein